MVPPILVAALRAGMLRLAGREGDGAIINWLSADDVAKVGGRRRSGAGKEIVARIFVAPSEDADTVQRSARYAIAAYLNVPVYAAFHEWLGRGPQLADMWRLWKEGDRKAALGRHPRRGGRPAHRPRLGRRRAASHMQRYIDNGVTTPALAFLASGTDTRQAIRDLAPARE